MEALLLVAAVLGVLFLGLWLGWSLGDADRASLVEANAQLRADVVAAAIAVRNARGVADALSRDDPRDRVRGLLDAGRSGDSPPGPNRGSDPHGGGVDLQRRERNDPPAGPGAAPPGPGRVGPGRNGPTG